MLRDPLAAVPAGQCMIQPLGLEVRDQGIFLLIFLLHNLALRLTAAGACATPQVGRLTGMSSWAKGRGPVIITAGDFWLLGPARFTCWEGLGPPSCGWGGTQDGFPVQEAERPKRSLYCPCANPGLSMFGGPGRAGVPPASCLLLTEGFVWCFSLAFFRGKHRLFMRTWMPGPLFTVPGCRAKESPQPYQLCAAARTRGGPHAWCALLFLSAALRLLCYEDAAQPEP